MTGKCRYRSEGPAGWNIVAHALRLMNTATVGRRALACAGKRRLTTKKWSPYCRSIKMPKCGVVDDVSPAAVRQWTRDANYGIARSEK